MLEGHQTASLPQIEELAEAGSMLPPDYQKKKGPNQHKRIRSQGHGNQAGKGGVNPPKCKNCGVPGHTATACLGPPLTSFSAAFGPIAEPFMCAGHCERRCVLCGVGGLGGD